MAIKAISGLFRWLDDLEEVVTQSADERWVKDLRIYNTIHVTPSVMMIIGDMYDIDIILVSYRLKKTCAGVAIEADRMGHYLHDLLKQLGRAEEQADEMGGV